MAVPTSGRGGDISAQGHRVRSGTGVSPAFLDLQAESFLWLLIHSYDVPQDHGSNTTNDIFSLLFGPEPNSQTRRLSIENKPNAVLLSIKRNRLHNGEQENVFMPCTSLCFTFQPNQSTSLWTKGLSVNYVLQQWTKSLFSICNQISRHVFDTVRMAEILLFQVVLSEWPF